MTLTTTPTIAECRAAVAAARAGGKSVALVPTMGALHDGHASLIERAREVADVVVVSIFVNPMQFGPSEDLAKYPRTPDADAAKLDELGVDVLFLPTPGEMYPDGRASTTVAAGPVGSSFEGRSRPGHFDGVLTVVTKLLHIVQPDVACFGEKDAQQLFLVQRLVRDLDIATEIVPVETVREPDGLAMSSRNRMLDGTARVDARAVPRALEAAASAADRGIEVMLAAAQGVLQGDSAVQLDYLSIVDPATFRAVADDHRGPVLVLIAARVGGVRLIDNLRCSIG